MKSHLPVLLGEAVFNLGGQRPDLDDFDLTGNTVYIYDAFGENYKGSEQEVQDTML